RHPPGRVLVPRADVAEVAVARRFAFVAFSCAALVSAWWAPAASAHATLERAVPGERARLDRPPAVLILFFDQPVAVSFSRVAVTVAAHPTDLVSGPLRQIGAEVLVPL